MSRGLKVRDIMSSPVVTASPDTNVFEIAKKMTEENIGSIVIVNEAGEVIGIITEDDLIKRVLAKGKDPFTTKAEEIMTKPIVYVSPDTDLKDAADIMVSKNIGHLVVIENGKLVGIIAEYDILRLAPNLLEVIYLRRRR